METIVIGKQHEKETTLENFGEKILCYSGKEVLIYKKSYGISIPSIERLSQTLIDVDPLGLEPLLSVVNYAWRYQSINNKLVKQYLKYIRAYYTYMVEFDGLFREKLKPLYINDKVYTPVIMDIEEAVAYVNQIYSTKRSKSMALEAFDCKVKGKQYARTNSNIESICKTV